MSNMQDSTSYKVGYGLATVLYKAIGGLVKLMWRGIKASFKNKYIAGVYLLLVLGAIVSYLLVSSFGLMFLIILVTVVGIGIWEYIKEIPVRRRRKYFYRIFNEIKLFYSDGLVPYYLSEEQISDYALSVSFHSLIPSSDWQAKKEELETIMNVKIIDMKQDERNYQITNLVIEVEPLPDYIEWDNYQIDFDKNILNIGMGYYGVVGMDLEKQPHAFIAGETGSGKSNILKCLIHQALLKEYDVIVIDFKRGVSFSHFKEAVTVYYEYPAIIKVLQDLVKETNNRLDMFRETGVDNIGDYNKGSVDYLHRKIVVIDELAELIKTRDKESSGALNDSIETLTRLSRATGIHLIMGIQRPDSTIVNGQIKNNVPYRVCGRFVDREPSRIMLNSDEASTLPNIKGRFIVKDDSFHEIQAFYFRGYKMEYPKKDHKKDRPEEAGTNAETKSNSKASPIRQVKKDVGLSEISKPKEPAGDFTFDFSDIREKWLQKKQSDSSVPKDDKDASVSQEAVILPFKGEVVPEPVKVIEEPLPANKEQEKAGLSKEEIEIIKYEKDATKFLDSFYEAKSIRENSHVPNSSECQVAFKALEEETYSIIGMTVYQRMVLLNKIIDKRISLREKLPKERGQILDNIASTAILLNGYYKDNRYDKTIALLARVKPMLYKE